jgi:BlaI family penicillinase repressor
MADMKLGVVETRFADLIWEHEPISSGELVKLCEEKLSWKKSTTYTILRRLCERGIFSNDKGAVTSLISKDEFYAMQSEKFVEDTFEGSLPRFLAAFSTRKKLSDDEINQLQKFIDEMR